MEHTTTLPGARMARTFDAHHPDRIAADLRAAANAFGVGLRRWRISNGWSQNTPQDWARAIGISPVANSQWSLLERGQMRAPEPKLFYSLGALNVLLAGENYGLIRDAKLRELVKGARPVLAEDGKPWTPYDFAACFMGAQSWPPMDDRRPLPTTEEAATASQSFRDVFRKTCQKRKQKPGPARRDLLAQVPAEHQSRVEDVLLGDDWTPQELAELVTEDRHALPELWLKAWNPPAGK